MSKNAAGIGITDPSEFASYSAAACPDFNPYDALGIPAAAYTPEELNHHYRCAQRHLIPASASASAPSFPGMAEINVARDYLLEVTARPSQRQRGSYARWERQPRTFFGELEIGDPRVFVPGATPTSGARSRPPPRQRQPREARDPFYTPPPRPARPRPPPRHHDRNYEQHSRRRSDSPARSPPRTRSSARPDASATPGATPSATPGSDRTGDFSGYTRRERTPPFGASAQNPHIVPSDDDDDDDSEVSDHVPPTPTPARSPPPAYTPRSPPPVYTPSAGGGRGHGRENIFRSRGDGMTTSSGAPPRPPPPPPRFEASLPRRQSAAPPPPTPPSGGAGGGAGGGGGGGSGGRSVGNPWMRMAPVENPVLGDEIVVGTWTRGSNAIIAVFDRRGRLNFRITNRNMAGSYVPAPTGTSTSLPSIILRWPYAGLDPAHLRAMIDQHIRLPRNQRP